MGRVASLIAVAGLLALGSGCVTADATKSELPKKPDVTKPGVLPPPQELMKPSGQPALGAVAPAGGVPPAAPLGQAGATVPAAPAAAAPAAATPGLPAPLSPLAKLTARTEKKPVPATEMAVAWRNRIAYLPDPSRNGAMGAGLAGQMFLYGALPRMEFAQADGTLTVDLIDDTPRPPGQPAAKPERWQFDKHTLRNLKTTDETFGKSYVLFLPWPAYRPDITRVRISARYDPDNGHTLFSPPSVITIDTSAPLGAPVWDGLTTTVPLGGSGRPQPSGNSMPGAAPLSVNNTPIPVGAPIPLGGSAPVGAVVPAGGATGAIPLGGPAPLTPIMTTIERK